MSTLEMIWQAEYLLRHASMHLAQRNWVQSSEAVRSVSGEVLAVSIGGAMKMALADVQGWDGKADKYDVWNAAVSAVLYATNSATIEEYNDALQRDKRQCINALCKAADIMSMQRRHLSQKEKRLV